MGPSGVWTDGFDGVPQGSLEVTVVGEGMDSRTGRVGVKVVPGEVFRTTSVL